MNRQRRIGAAGAVVLAVVWGGVLAIRAIEPAIAAAATAEKPAEQKEPAVGDKAKDFTLKTLDAKDVTLAERLKRGPAVVVFLRGYPGYQCPLCTRQVGELMSKAKEIDATGAGVVLIYPGSEEKLKEHAKEFLGGKELPAPLTLVTDEDMKVVKEWNLRWDAKNETAYPSAFVVDKGGVIRFGKISKGHGGRASAQEIIDAIKAMKPE